MVRKAVQMVVKSANKRQHRLLRVYGTNMFSRAGIHDSNGRFLANIQKQGRFSVVAWIACGEVKPENYA